MCKSCVDPLAAQILAKSLTYCAVINTNVSTRSKTYIDPLAESSEVADLQPLQTKVFICNNPSCNPRGRRITRSLQSCEYIERTCDLYGYQGYWARDSVKTLEDQGHEPQLKFASEKSSLRSQRKKERKKERTSSRHKTCCCLA